MMRVFTLWLLVALMVGTVMWISVAPALAQPWLPDDCEGVHWYNPSEAWACLSAIASSLFGGWPGWVPE